MELERDQFEEAALAHFVAQRAAGVTISGDNGCETTRESLFWRDDKGDYGVRMFNAAWWGWKEATVATRKTCEVPTLDEAIRQAHWAHWAAEEHHVVAVSVRHLRLLANHNDAATTQAAAQPPAPDEAAREYMTGYSDGREWAGATNQAQPSQAGVVELSDAEIKKISSDLSLYEDYQPESCQADYLDPVKFARAIIAAINAKEQPNG